MSSSSIHRLLRTASSIRQYSTPCLRHQSRSLTINAASDGSSTAVVKPFKTDLLPEIFPPSKKSGQTSDSTASEKTLFRIETTLLKANLIDPIIRSLPSTSQNASKIAFIDGQLGVGKSVILSQTVAHARDKGFIVLYMPDAKAWTDGPGFFSPAVKQDMDLIEDGISSVRYYNRPMQTHSTLKNLKLAHEDALAQISCDPKLASDSTAHCSTLLDLVSFGISQLDDIDSNWRAIPCLATEVLSQTIHQLCASRDTPFAIVIDDYHYMIGMTCMVSDRKRRLHSNSIRTIAQLLGRDSIENLASQNNSGFILLASESKPPFSNWKRSRVVGVSDFPLGKHVIEDPSGREWLRGFKTRVSDPENANSFYIRVSDCAPGELKAMCATFSAKGLRKEQVSNVANRLEADRLAILAGGRGKEMSRIFATR